MLQETLLFSVTKTVWEITDIWFFPCFYSFSTPILWAGFNPGPFTFSCPDSSLKLATLDPGRWCGAEVLGDSGTGRCCLRRQRRERKPCLLYLWSVEAYLSLFSARCILWLQQFIILATQLGSLEPTVKTADYFHPQRCKYLLLNTKHNILKICYSRCT